MTFRDLIEGMHEKESGVRAGALAGIDGLAVEEWRKMPSRDDIPALCAEMVQLFRESGRIALENGLGGTEEIVLAGEAGQVFVRKVTEDYFLLMVADPGVIPGKCRYLLRRGAQRAREML
jgi:predicted regulator of Ras-like GTPase activity (Roadblock/LC7/MglB family)